MKMLSRADEMVLLAVWRLKENAYGVPIRKLIIEMTDQEWSVGAVYDSLERLTLSGFLTAFQADPTPERGGRRKRFFRITRSGYESLVRTKRAQERLWDDLPDLGFEPVK